MSRMPVVSVTIKDMEIQTFRSGGKGGQHQNTTESGVRLIHHPSGARGESREERDQHRNKRSAFLRLVNSEKFLFWLKIEHSRRLGGESIEQRVARMMESDDDFLIEVLTERGWERK